MYRHKVGVVGVCMDYKGDGHFASLTLPSLKPAGGEAIVQASWHGLLCRRRAARDRYLLRGNRVQLAGRCVGSCSCSRNRAKYVRSETATKPLPASTDIAGSQQEARAGDYKSY